MWQTSDHVCFLKVLLCQPPISGHLAPLLAPRLCLAISKLHRPFLAIWKPSISGYAEGVSQVRRPSDKTAADEFQLGTSGGVSEIEPALQNTVVAAIAVSDHFWPPRPLVAIRKLIWKSSRPFLAIWLRYRIGKPPRLFLAIRKSCRPFLAQFDVRKQAKFGGPDKTAADEFQLGTSGGVSEIEPALQNTVVAAIAVSDHFWPPRPLVAIRKLIWKSSRPFLAIWLRYRIGKPPRLFLAIWKLADHFWSNLT